MDKSKIYLIDLDGTIYSGEKALPYAAEFFRYLSDNNIRYFVVTNCPSKSCQAVSLKLKRMGIDCPHNRIITSGMVAARLIKKDNPTAKIFVVGGSALKKEIAKCGLRLGNKNVGYVLVGYDEKINYKMLMQATNLVLAGAKLICTNCDMAIPHKNQVAPHTGAIAKVIEAAALCTTKYFGKPEKYMFEVIQNISTFDCLQYVMIGDNLLTDIKFANNCNIKCFLMLSGVTSQQQASNTNLRIDKVFNNLKEIIDY